MDDHNLFILQVSPGRRTARASVRVAVDLVAEGLISQREAVLRVDAAHMSYFQAPVIDPTNGERILSIESSLIFPYTCT